MVLHKRPIRRDLSVLVTLGALMTVVGCVSYDTRSLSPDDGLPIRVKDIVIVHHGNRVFQIGDPDLENGALVGYLIDSPDTNKYTGPRELHVYVNHSHPIKSKPEGSTVSIPIEAIRRVEIRDVALKRSIVNTGILGSLLTIGGLYVYSSVMYFFLFMSL